MYQLIMQNSSKQMDYASSGCQEILVAKQIRWATCPKKIQKNGWAKYAKGGEMKFESFE